MAQKDKVCFGKRFWLKIVGTRNRVRDIDLRYYILYSGLVKCRKNIQNITSKCNFMSVFIKTQFKVMVLVENATSENQNSNKNTV